MRGATSAAPSGGLRVVASGSVSLMMSTQTIQADAPVVIAFLTELTASKTSLVAFRGETLEKDYCTLGVAEDGMSITVGYSNGLTTVNYLALG